MYFINNVTSLQTEYVPITIEEEVASKLLKQLTLYHNDKSLIITFLAITSAEGKVIPIYLIPGKLENVADENILEIDLDKKYINPEFEFYIKNILESKDSENLLDTLNDIADFNQEDFIKLHLLLESQKIIKGDNLSGFFNTIKRKEIKTITTHTIFSQLSIGLIRRSIKLRSLLNDLNKLQEKKMYSKPLEFLFSLSKFSSSSKLDLFSPFTLNPSQETIAINCLKYPISLVTGPPGTGKSFTIAAVALNAAIQGKSVLITSKTDQAVDVISDKLKNEFEAEELIMRGGGGTYKKDLKFKLKQLVSFKTTNEKRYSLNYLKTKNRIQDVKSKLKKLNGSINKRLIKECKLSEFIITDSGNFFTKKWKNYQINKVLKRRSLIALIKEKQKSLQHLRTYQRQYINHFYQYNLFMGVKSHRKNITAFNSSLGARTNVRKDSYFSEANINSLLKFLPIWLINLQDIGNVFPLKKELFDLIIIDEASQVDIASSLPALFRAQNAIVVGDPLQLRHVSFLSNDKEEQLKEDYKLTSENWPAYRESSLYDLCDQNIENTKQTYVLHEHYRSKPGIINFSNHYYYGNQLQNFKREYEHDLGLGLKFISINGERNDKGFNQSEIDYVFKILRASLKRKRDIKSVGIISPFRDHVDAIRKQVDEKLSYEQIKKLQLRVDTPYGFQGDERDIIILSLAIDDNSASMVHQYLNKPGVFNVSVTRSREFQYILYSFKPTKLPQDSILRKYFEFEHKSEVAKSTYSDDFLESVLKYLQSIGVDNFTINKEIGNLLIDISFFHNEKLYAIDLVGFPGEQESYLNLNEHSIIDRLDNELIIISYLSWQLDRKRIELDLFERLN